MIYNLKTDRIATPEPSLPVLGPAGSSYVDPVFNTKITRVTDEAFSQSIGAPRRSWSTGSGGEQNTWAKDCSAFIIQDLGGGVWVPFSLTGKIPTPDSYFLPLNGPAFSYSEARVLFGRSRDDGGLCKYNLDTQAITRICSFPHLAIGEVSPSGNDRVVTFGNGSQDKANEVYLWDGSGLQVLDTTTGKLDGAAVSTIGVSFPFGIHNARMDRSGRFVVITSSTSFDGTNWKADAGSPLIVWDVEQRKIYPVGPQPNGHKCSGNGQLINQEVADTAWDGMQWLIRSLESPNTVRSLINPVLQPAGLNRDSHLSWNNHTGQQEPVLISIYRNQSDASERDSPFRAWDNEIILVSTDNSGVVYRVCHHRTFYENFWDGPHAVISPDGAKALFTSNMGKSLGIADDGESRRDVFWVELAQSGVAPLPEPGPVPTPIPTPTPTPTPSPTPVPEIPVGSRVEVTSRVNVREAASSSSPIKRVAEIGEVGKTTTTPQLDSASGNVFVSVDFTVGLDGFVAVQFLKLAAETPAPTPVPPPVPAPAPSTRTVSYPKQTSKRNAILAAQWKERYRLKSEGDTSAVFEKVP